MLDGDSDFAGSKVWETMQHLRDGSGFLSLRRAAPPIIFKLNIVQYLSCLDANRLLGWRALFCLVIKEFAAVFLIVAVAVAVRLRVLSSR